MQYNYSKGWFRAKKSSLAKYTEEDARKTHNNHKLYCVIVGDIKKPDAFLEINNDFYGVTFLDKLLRPTLEYQFSLQKNGKLFLTMATYRKYKDKSDTVAKGTTYIFHLNGKMKIQKQAFPSGKQSESHGSFELVKNWEEVPAFGEYQSLLKQER